MTPRVVSVEGFDNSGKPRQQFADRIAVEDDATFSKTAENYIWLSTYAVSNPGSDYHWMDLACDQEAKRRGKPELYDKAYRKVMTQ